MGGLEQRTFYGTEVLPVTETLQITKTVWPIDRVQESHASNLPFSALNKRETPLTIRH